MTFNPAQLLPNRAFVPVSPSRNTNTNAHPHPHTNMNMDSPDPFGALPERPLSSAHRSVSPSSVFDQAEADENPDDTDPTNLNSGQNSASEEPASYDLKPPPPSVSHSNIE
ncbi:hypothetical protein LTR66_012926, partial [Elasticomyces elasticus]